jgi:uncharacterized hydrophobic protein (TIGR00271 family)
MAEAHGGANIAVLEANGSDGPLDLLIAHLPNQQIEGLIEDLQQLPDLRITLIPQGTMPLQPPRSEAPEQVKDVQWRSPVEVFLGGLQSVGSWRGFLGYAAAAGVVVWIGLFTNTIYLLTAAMLLAPFAGPAMNLALATARGDGRLARQSMVRYVASLVTTIAVAALLSFLLQQEVATPQMVERSQISVVAVLLPLAAGIGGALNLLQSERSSLVSGAAVGMLVAASLAPPAGVVGMASVIGEWDMVKGGVFQLVLQLAGINLSGATVFWLAGLTPKGVRYRRGTWWMFPVLLAVTAVVLAGLLLWQFSEQPDLQRSSRAQRATAVVQNVVNQSDLAELVEANVRFTRANIPGQNTLLAVVYVQRTTQSVSSDQEIRLRLTLSIQNRLLEAGFDVMPLVDVQVLAPPRVGEQ